MAPTGQGEGDIQGLRGVESKLERCQLVASIWIELEYDAEVANI